MASVEGTHWWYRALHQRVLEGIRRCRKSDDARILDAGCGTGGLMAFLQNRGYRNLSGFDLSPYAVEICRDKGLSVKRGDISKIDAIFDGAFDVIISNDVLCYFGEDRIGGLTEKIGRKLKPGGVFMGNLPAFDAFDGIHDISVGIKKRYDKRLLFKLIDRGAFRWVDADYWPFILSPAVFLARFAQRIRLRLNPESEIRSDVGLPNARVNELLFRTIWLENKLLKRKPWASSLFVILRKFGP
jgi:SAM-dependent methyltransferase